MMVCLVMLMAWTTAMGIKKPNTERWPDGAEIDAWFSDTSRVDVSGLKHYVVTDYGVDPWCDGVQTKALQAVIDKFTEEGEKVYYVPMGGSNEIGMLGYVECAMELDRQARELGIGDATVYVTVGSMGTYLGMLIGLKECRSDLKLAGINVLPYSDDAADEKANDEALREALCDYYKNVCETFAGYSENWGITADDFNIMTHYIHGAYNNAVAEVREVMYYLARKEAIIIDPCYTGKTFEALVDGAKSGSIEKGSNVIFMHTGGLPGIYTKHHRVELERELMPYMHMDEF